MGGTLDRPPVGIEEEAKRWRDELEPGERDIEMGAGTGEGGGEGGAAPAPEREEERGTEAARRGERRAGRGERGAGAGKEVVCVRVKCSAGGVFAECPGSGTRQSSVC